ncbi:MAG TPA: OmpA family protein [Solimonas sp.]|nr:OmpA family protein [Solimonas sp.]
MKTLHGKSLIAAAAASMFLLACAAGPTKPAGADIARSKLTQLQADPQLASRAPLAIKEAESAVAAAEQPRDDQEYAAHLVVIADRKVGIAWAQAQARLAEDQRKTLSEQRETARLDSRTREADVARSDANSARTEAEIARTQADSARSDAEAARIAAEAARGQAESARNDTEAARLQALDLQRQIAELNAKATDRGLVVTLGDVLFASGRSELKGGATSNLAKLSAFLNKYPDRTVIIEGHTDNVGSDDSNMGLSQRRADSVRSFLLSQGVAGSRVSALGKGESSPTAGNDSATGRQQNRRVEVIISNTVTSSR